MFDRQCCIVSKIYSHNLLNVRHHILSTLHSQHMVGRFSLIFVLLGQDLYKDNNPAVVACSVFKVPNPYINSK